MHQRPAQPTVNCWYPLSSPTSPGRIAFIIDTGGIVQLVVEGMPNNKKVIADIERLLK